MVPNIAKGFRITQQVALKKSVDFFSNIEVTVQPTITYQKLDSTFSYVKELSDQVDLRVNLLKDDDVVKRFIRTFYNHKIIFHLK